jgi:methylenetetrahydrofolate dehydrogenase (NAD+)
LRDSVDHKCDVEGLCHLYRTNLYRNVRYLDPPTNSEKCKCMQAQPCGSPLNPF